MHWTQAILFALFAISLVWNAFGVVRPVGLIVGSAWVVQQTYWIVTGADSQTLFIAGDAAIVVAYVLSSHRWTDTVIVLLLPVCWLSQAAASLDPVAMWWLNWWIVMMQMVLGMPWRTRYREGCLA